MKSGYSYPQIVAFITLCVLLVVWVWCSSPGMQIWFENRAAQIYINDIVESQKNDTFGGTTPEETMALFADAIEKGDVDLAVKYFRMDRVNFARIDLTEMKKADGFGLLKSDLSGLRVARQDDTSAYLVSTSSEPVSISLEIDSITGRWKIVEL